ncbi:efflux RND transporter permease subunit [Ignavibacteria bacterium CHB1]|nr:MAG: efflux RND transporter permease subunit [Chlorobiota bacterium]MBV6399071.1 Efflux pump membrane transporter BepE [Ignavibacteria bacterium]MCC6885289.1 efflux RND transporter permease subunit [Ignavibacteriales bacterium]MCE7953308.1 efflux RND transporter permease subunit [Chlorobi bacterium CHB7]MDL1887274.1 efflux RND transporter permease subunit [Ignavibacteria bacterium CHB1]RIK48422.1 MAG: acriflavin resistance protein [Ignavibacteriota bacterium]
MSLSSVSIKRPVLTIVINLILIIFGIVAFTNLEVREYPNVDPPIVTVTTVYPGANADVIETQITEPLEQSLNGIEGIKTLTSTSRDESSVITIEFELERSLEDAANDVRDRVSSAQRNLPPDIDNPVVRKADADAMPIIFLYVKSDKRNLMEVSNFATNIIKERLQTINGVASVNVFGEKKYSMRLWLDPVKLTAHGITAIDIQNAINRENIELPSGRIEGDDVELTIRTLGRLNTVDEFNNLIIKDDGINTVKFSDVGNAEIYPENDRTGFRQRGVPGIGVSIQAIPGSNLIQISDDFWERFAQLEKEVPEDISLEVGFDFSEYVRTTIDEVESTIFIAFVLVIMIIFLFLRDWRSTFIPVISIPVSIIAAFFVLFLVDFSINVLTLVGIILAIGLVVDDAIVVLENIYTKIEQGIPPRKAAFLGAREIYFAVISTTLSLVVVFLPILFLEGLVGRLFREFGVTISAAVLISSFVALSLTPMLSSRLLKKHDKTNKFYNLTEPFFVKLISVYRSQLSFFMKYRWTPFIIIFICGVLIYIIGSGLPSELAPLEDRSNIRLSVTAPEGATFDYTQRYMADLTDMIIDSIPEAPNPTEIIAPSWGRPGATNIGIISLYLVRPAERDRTQQQVFGQLSKMIGGITGIRAFPIQPPTIGSRFARQPVQYVIQAPNYESLIEVLPKFLEEANKSDILQFADADLKVNKPEVSISVNREKANLLGVSTIDIARTLQAALSGYRYGNYIQDGKQYQVIGQVKRENRNDPYDLQYLFVKNKEGKLIQLDNLISIEETVTATTRNRYNRFISATVTSGLEPGYTIGDGITEMDRIASLILGPNFSTSLAGESKDYKESSSSLVFIFIFALVVVFLVLSAQFESFVDPFIIMFTVPLALTGAILSLWLFGQTMNVFSQIGIIMLIGLVTKNAILIVEFSNQKKLTGLSVIEAVQEGAVARFRPILMTTLSTVLGILPIAIGIGAESRTSLGIAVVGGLIFSTFLSLYVVPAVYSYFSRTVRQEEVDIEFAENELVNLPD